MTNVAPWTGHDERGTNTVGLALVLVLLLVLLASATQFGSALAGVRVRPIQDSGIVAAQQQELLRQRVAAAQGVRPLGSRRELVQQQTRLALVARNSPGAPVQEARERFRTLPARWSRQLGAFLFETCPEGLLDLVLALRHTIRQILQ